MGFNNNLPPLFRMELVSLALDPRWHPRTLTCCLRYVGKYVQPNSTPSLFK